MHFILTAGCSRMGMSPAESLRAAALELTDGRGTLAPGAPGDLVLWRASSAAEIPYRLAAPIIQGVWKAGERVV